MMTAVTNDFKKKIELIVLQNEKKTHVIYMLWEGPLNECI